ncbi:SpaA isopeptide-forming pilin-related protein [Sediminivirga luteola]|uniref:VWFA domain-containing protein n=1 Tax=Sediminivirga luteola TaxID=1774748 RepID=A0A8J2U0X8_9MICO|nr:SpaA isopeptide-forming pilin-related protein [Sediminivirga luteola]GGA25794.1 hypothetical protein GCM10011333_30930 [Sediminivirga luteola]
MNITKTGHRRLLRTLAAMPVALGIAVAGIVALPPGTAQAAVPSPTPATSVVTVKTGGDRSGGSSVAPLEGVVLHLRTGGTGGPGEARADGVSGDGAGWARCVSDTAGDCSFIVPGTQQGGANRSARFWVVQHAAPEGWFVNSALRTGSGDGTGSQSTRYAFRTPQLLGNTTYASTQAGFMLNTSSSQDTQATRDASGGIWQQSRANPALPDSCGLDVALVLDLSNSVSNNGVLDDLKAQADVFTDALVGTPSRMALYSFGTYSPSLPSQPNNPDLTAVTTQAAADAFKRRYANWVTPTMGGNAMRGGTNWDQGLYIPSLAAGTPGTPNHYDAAVVVTDGNPTFYGPNATTTSGGREVANNGNGNFTRIREVENGVFSANALKAKGTRVIAMGVGPGITDPLTGQNLSALSGQEAYDPSGGNVLTADYYQLDDFAEAADALRQLVEQQCASSLTVTKMIVPEGNEPGDLSGAVPAGAGWEFTAQSPAVPAPNSRTTTNDGTGAVSFPLTVESGSARIDVRETQQDGFTYLGQECTVRTPGGPAAREAEALDDDAARPGFSVEAARGEQISCLVYNTAAELQADVTVNKAWRVNGTDYAQGAQPSELGAGLALTGPDDAPATGQGWGITRFGYRIGEDIGIGEGMFYGAMDRCELVSATVTAINGRQTELGFPAREGNLPAEDDLLRVTLTEEHNVIDVRNVVECTSELTLKKEVQGGDADPAGWTLTAIPGDGALPGPVGASGTAEATAPVTPESLYQLAESGGDPRYKQVDQRPRPLVNPDSTGSWQCVLVDTDGNPVSGTVDGLNGGATVPLGQAMECTAVNQTSTLTLLKHVVDPQPGGHAAGDWTLSAAPEDGIDGLDAEHVPGSEEPAEGSTVLVRPEHVYTLGEDGPPGYVQTLERLAGTDAETGEEIWEAVDGTEVSVPRLEHETYRLVNERERGSIGWQKAIGGSGQPLAGSTWRITGPGHPADDPLIVEDEEMSGSFLVEGLDWGEYTVTEIEAPAGYVLGEAPPEFRAVISGDALHYVHPVPLENQQREVVLPIAGGMGWWPYLAGGVLLLLLAAAFLVRAHRAGGVHRLRG